MNKQLLVQESLDNHVPKTYKKHEKLGTKENIVVPTLNGQRQESLIATTRSKPVR